MALGTYSGLQTSVANWLERADLASVIPDFIALAEARINRVLRVADMEAHAIGTSTNGVMSLPADFIGWRRVEAPSYGALDLVDPNWAANEYPTGAGGTPKFFTIQGLTLTTYPVFTGDIGLDYYAAIPALSDAAPTNWLLARAPDLYLAMTLAEAKVFAQDAQGAVLWDQKASAIIDELNKQDVARRYSRVSARVRGPTP